MKTALVHDWLIGFAGGEHVLQAVSECLDGPIYTLLKDQKILNGTCFESKEIYTSFLQKFPGSKSYYRNLLPLFPKAIESFDLSNYDFIFSSSHSVAKSVITHPHQLHICYCFTPMRYAWDLYAFHLSHISSLKRPMARLILNAMRRWDQQTAPRVSHYVAISHYIAKRIQAAYQQEADVIYPPVNTHLFDISEKKEDYYFTCSRFVPYKRIDLIVDAFKQMPDKKLVIIGDGPERSKIQANASKNVEFLGHMPHPVLREVLSQSRAFLFAAEEDFGIVNVEAQSAGIPVIAYGMGGAKETVLAGETGLFFKEQNSASLREAISRFEKMEGDFDPVKIKEHAEKFSKARFQKEMQTLIAAKQEAFQNRT